MARNTSILLGDYFNEFIGHQVETGRFSSASEVVRTALRFFEKELSKEQQLVAELKKGENLGFVDNFNKDTFLKELHKKHIK
ncbi:MAG: type II toxin-antitoxin system ParD family antitoxin [Flavobacteriaceae bacterium]|nr:type II toxin-antitoxin system ParD family antitoxin [Flavobacteriaceae bacterium]